MGTTPTDAGLRWTIDLNWDRMVDAVRAAGADRVVMASITEANESNELVACAEEVKTWCAKELETERDFVRRDRLWTAERRILGFLMIASLKEAA